MSNRHEIEKILSDIKKTIVSASPNTDVLELTDKVEGQQFTSSMFKKNNNEGDNIQRNHTTIPKDYDYRLLDHYENLIDKKTATESMEAFQNAIKLLGSQDLSNLKLKGGLSLEETIIELLKQQLSDWLNKNLSSIVQGIVEKEIKKLIPKDE